MLIPFVVDRKLFVFHVPLAEPKYSPKAVATFFPGYAPVAPLAFDKFVVLDVRLMEASQSLQIHAYSWKQRVFGLA